MTRRPPALELLAWAVDVASASISGAADADPGNPTPCTEWNLGTLVRHVADSAATIRELLEGGPRRAPPPPGCHAAQAELRRLLEAIDSTPPGGIGVDLAALTGAYELAVHAWDINRATGRPDALPVGLVDTLLTYAPHVLGEIERVRPVRRRGASRGDPYRHRSAPGPVRTATQPTAAHGLTGAARARGTEPCG